MTLVALVLDLLNFFGQLAILRNRGWTLTAQSNLDRGDGLVVELGVFGARVLDDREIVVAALLPLRELLFQAVVVGVGDEGAPGGVQSRRCSPIRSRRARVG